MKGIIKQCLLASGIALAILILSWGVTVGIIKLITLCFGWNFSLLTATGIWMAMFLVSAFFKSNNSSK